MRSPALDLVTQKIFDSEGTQTGHYCVVIIQSVDCEVYNQRNTIGILTKHLPQQNSIFGILFWSLF